MDFLLIGNSFGDKDLAMDEMCR